MLSNIEFKLVEKDVLCGLAKGNEALREIQEHMKIEDIEAIMDDTQEAMAYQRHVSELLTAQLSDADEEEVEHELEKLQRDEMAAFEERIPSVPKVPIAQASLGFEEEQGRTRRDGPVGHGSQALPAT